MRQLSLSQGITRHYSQESGLKCFLFTLVENIGKDEQDLKCFIFISLEGSLDFMKWDLFLDQVEMSDIFTIKMSVLFMKLFY